MTDCAACLGHGEGRGRRDKRPCCKSCLRLSRFKWESALMEAARIRLATAIALLLLAGCVPRPSHYCPFTCSSADAAWESTMADPNDPERIPWCVCTHERAHFAIPGRDPRGGR